MDPAFQLQPDQQVLTPAQEEEARRFFAERFQAQLSTEPVDEQETEVILRRFYQQALHLPPPTHIQWVDDPLQLIALLAPTSAQDNLGGNIWRQVQAMLDNSPPVVYGVPSIHGGLRKCLQHWAEEDPLQERLRRSIIHALWDGLRATLGKSLWNHIEDSIRAFPAAYPFVLYSFGPFYPAYLESKDLADMARFNECVSGWWLGTEGALIVRRPCTLAHDEAGRLHSATGHAIEYPDGWGLYVWHGVRVPERVILAPERLSRDDFLTAANAEVRRVIQERMGQRFVPELGGSVIDRSPRGTLYEVHLPEDDPEGVARYVQVQDASTARHYFLRVPPTIQTAREAVAWSFDVAVQEYGPAHET